MIGLKKGDTRSLDYSSNRCSACSAQRSRNYLIPPAFLEGNRVVIGVSINMGHLHRRQCARILRMPLK